MAFCTRPGLAPRAISGERQFLHGRSARPRRDARHGPESGPDRVAGLRAEV